VLEYGSNSLDKDVYLSSIEILSKNTITGYEFEPNDFKLILSNDSSEYPLEKAVVKSISTFNIRNHILTYQSFRYQLPSKELIGKDETCYIVGDLSYFWWSVIGHKLEKIRCVN
jgi:hypothetical protein